MEGMEGMSLDRWKIHFQHSCWLLKHSLINMIFFCKYYGLVISLCEIDHTGPNGTGYQRNENYMCVINKHVHKNYKRLAPDPQDWP